METRQGRNVIGSFGFLLGAVALLLVLVQFWGGPFAPQQSAGVTIGDLAAEIRQSALRGIKGEPQPAPETVPWDIDRTLQLAAALLAGAAVIAGALAVIRREEWRPAAAAAALGSCAMLFQLFTWAVLVIAGMILIGAILQNVDGILGG